MIANPALPAYRYDPYGRQLTHEHYDQTGGLWSSSHLCALKPRRWIARGYKLYELTETSVARHCAKSSWTQGGFHVQDDKLVPCF